MSPIVSGDISIALYLFFKITIMSRATTAVLEKIFIVHVLLQRYNFVLRVQNVRFMVSLEISTSDFSGYDSL